MTKKQDVGKKIAGKKEMVVNCGKKKLGNVEDLEVDQGKKEKERVDSLGNKEVEVVDGGKRKRQELIVRETRNEKEQQNCKIQYR